VTKCEENLYTSGYYSPREPFGNMRGRNLISPLTHMDILLVLFLSVIGVTGLVKKRIKISSRRVVTGRTAVLLSAFYILLAAVVILGGLGLIVVAIAGSVTLAVVLFARGDAIGAETIPDNS